MAIVTFNPYPELGDKLIAGLDKVAASLTPTSSVEDFANAIFNYIQPIFYPASAPGVSPPQIDIELKSVIYNIINAYSSKGIENLPWTEQQVNFICMLLGSKTTTTTPVNALAVWLKDIQDNIPEVDLSIEEQSSLLFGTGAGLVIYNYWIGKVATPGEWNKFFDAREPHNFANIPIWTAACIEGALIGANASQKGLIAPSTDIVSVQIVSALIGAITIGAGKVIFKWVPEITPRELTTDASGYMSGGFSDAFGGNMGSALKGSNNCGTGGCMNQCVNDKCPNTGKCTTINK